MGRLFGVPPLPLAYVPRNGDHDKIVGLLVNNRIGNAALPATVAIFAETGMGKNVVATAVVYDTRVQAHFADGIIWLRSGKPHVLRRGPKSGETPEGASFAIEQKALHLFSTLGETLGWKRSEISPEAIKKQIGDKQLLIVLANHCEPEVATLVLSSLGPNCRLLVTVSKPTAFDPSHPVAFHTLTKMTVTQCTQMLQLCMGENVRHRAGSIDSPPSPQSPNRRALNGTPPAFPPPPTTPNSLSPKSAAAAEADSDWRVRNVRSSLVHMSDGVVLALAIMGSTLRNIGHVDIRAWDQVVEEIREEMDGLVRASIGSRSSSEFNLDDISLHAALTMAEKEVGPWAWERLVLLAAVPDGEAFPVAAARALWMGQGEIEGLQSKFWHPAGKDTATGKASALPKRTPSSVARHTACAGAEELTVDELLDRLEDFSLIQRDPAEDVISVHPKVRDFLRHRSQASSPDHLRIAHASIGGALLAALELDPAIRTGAVALDKSGSGGALGEQEEGAEGAARAALLRYAGGYLCQHLVEGGLQGLAEDRVGSLRWALHLIGRFGGAEQLMMDFELLGGERRRGSLSLDGLQRGEVDTRSKVQVLLAAVQDLRPALVSKPGIKLAQALLGSLLLNRLPVLCAPPHPQRPSLERLLKECEAWGGPGGHWLRPQCGMHTHPPPVGGRPELPSCLVGVAGGRACLGLSSGTVKVYRAADLVEERVLKGHTSTVESLAAAVPWRLDSAAGPAPEGEEEWAQGWRQVVVSASKDMSARVWDLRTGTCTAVLRGHSDALKCVAVAGGLPTSSSSSSPPRARNYLYVVTGSRDYTGRLWQGPCRVSGEGIPLTPGAVPEGTLLADLKDVHSNYVRACVFLGTQYVVTGSWDGLVVVWSVPDGRKLHELAGHTRGIYGLQPLGQDYVVSASDDNTLRLWDVKQGAHVSTMVGHTSPVVSVCALGKEHVVSASFDNMLRVWHAPTGACRAVLVGHTAWVSLVAELDGGRVVSASYDLTVCLWQALPAADAPPPGAGGEPPRVRPLTAFFVGTIPTAVCAVSPQELVIADKNGTLHSLKVAPPA